MGPFRLRRRDNSRNRSEPLETIRYPESNYPQTGNYSPTGNRRGFTAGRTVLLTINLLEVHASRKRENTRCEIPARRQIEKYGAPKLGDYRQVPARAWVDPIFLLIRTTNRSSKRAHSRRPRKGKRRPKKARQPAITRTALGTTTPRTQRALRRERSEWRVARRKRRRCDDG